MPEIRLHLRIIVEPTITTQTLVDACRSVFAQAGVSINVRSKRILNLSAADQLKFMPVKVRNSCKGAGLTSEQTDLFGLAASVDSRHVVVLLVHSTDKAMEGCAQHPAGRPGAIVTSIAAKWTMAHELGHLLGLVHVTAKSRLMYNGGTIGITANPPVLNSSEISQINQSNLLH